jgi:hypothetical protein
VIVLPTPLLQQSLIDLKFKGSSPATTSNRGKFEEVTCHKFEILHKNKFFRRPNNHLVCDYSSISYRHLLLVKYKVPLTYLNTLASFIRYSLRGDHGLSDICAKRHLRERHLREVGLTEKGSTSLRPFPLT